MKSALAFLTAAVGLLSHTAHAQHYNWDITCRNETIFEGVHPDTIRNDSLGFSNEKGEMRWVSLDSVVTLEYYHNPMLITFIVMGGVLGALTDGNVADPEESGGIRWGRVAVGAGFGAGIGYVVGWSLGEEEIDVRGLPPGERNEIIRKRVAARTGRVTVVQ